MLLYSSNVDVKKIDTLIDDIRAGRISRNKHFFSLAEVATKKRFKRAKLLMSVIDDLNRTASVFGNTIEIKKGSSLFEIRLFNPILRYRRQVTLTAAELDLIKSKTGIT